MWITNAEMFTSVIFERYSFALLAQFYQGAITYKYVESFDYAQENLTNCA